jgi:hypothetical protein
MPLLAIMSEEVRLMPRFNRLRGLGPFGNALANLLGLLTVNWGIAVSAAAGIAAALMSDLREVALNPITYVGVGAFLTVLWTIIGITVLVDRRRPRTIRAHVDYRYGLTFEGIQPRYLPPQNVGFPNSGSLSFSISTRNFLQHPIHYVVEHIDIRLGTRAIPRIRSGNLTGYLSRAAGKTISIQGFSQAELQEFYDADPARGTVEFAIVYGPPEGPPERRLKMEIEFYVILREGGNSIGWQENILSEADEPY